MRTIGAGKGIWLRTLLLFVAAALFSIPVALMVTGSLKADSRVLSEIATLQAWLPADISLQNYVDVFERVPFLQYFANSMFINGAIAGAGLIINGFAGYALARLEWKGKNLLLITVMALLVIPFEAIAVPLFFQLSALGWRNDFSVQILPFVANPLAIYLFYSFFLDFPRELEEAARMDNAGPLRCFIHIVIPNSKAVFATVAIVSFLLNWGMYLWPLLMTVDEDVRPLPLAMATFYTLPPLQWGDILAFGIMMVAPIVALFALTQRWYSLGMVKTGIKG